MGSSLACNYETRVEVTEGGKHSILLQYGNNYGCKKFYSTGMVLSLADTVKELNMGRDMPYPRKIVGPK